MPKEPKPTRPTPIPRTPPTGKIHVTVQGGSVFDAEGVAVNDPGLAVLFQAWLASLSATPQQIAALTAKLRGQSDALASTVASGHPDPQPKAHVPKAP